MGAHRSQARVTLSPGQLLLSSLHGAGVHVLGLAIGIRAQFDADDPRVL